MSSLGDWQIPPGLQPNPEEYDYDLEAALEAIVGVRSIIPADAFTAETLGTERAGNGVLMQSGIVLTIGYLVTEAETIWLTLSDGRAVEGHALAYDQPTGFALVQPLARLDMPGLPIGDSGRAEIGDSVVVAGAAGREGAVAAQIVARQEFAGYWEYVLDDAIFTAPVHPRWGGTAVIDEGGEIIGIGSLQLMAAGSGGEELPLNMVVPIDILKPVLDDLLTQGRRSAPPRPWLGLYATAIEDRVVIFGLARGGPGEKAGVQTGDIVAAVAGTAVDDLAEFYRTVWSIGDAGVEVPLTLLREGETLEVTLVSTDRTLLLKAPRLH
jgi:S1-C subfamily serine protease